MSDKTIAALFDDFENAARAVKHIESAGLRPIEISLIAHNRGDRYSHYLERTPEREGEGDDVSVGTAIGAALGGSVGMLAGLSLLLVPGIGPAVAAGTFLATLVGAGAGAAVGALAGSLVDAGLDPHDAAAYEEGVRRGGTLVVVRTTDDNIDKVVEIFDREGAIDMEEREEEWRSAGWSGVAAAHPL